LSGTSLRSVARPDPAVMPMIPKQMSACPARPMRSGNVTAVAGAVNPPRARKVTRVAQLSRIIRALAIVCIAA
jgi:hypothetical protein